MGQRNRRRCGEGWRKAFVAVLLGVGFVCPHVAEAQESAFVGREEQYARMERGIEDVMMVGDEMFCTSEGVLFGMRRMRGEVTAMLADTLYCRLKDNIDYMVVHPTSGDLFFTTKDKKGRSALYQWHVEADKHGKEKGKLTKMKVEGMEVEHPCFSDDGRVMVFSARSAQRGRGGYDLWYAEYKNGEFSRPINMGERINTTADERHPVVYHGQLVFSSNGHSANPRQYNLYSTWLIADHAIGDTVGMLHIGRSPVQHLPEPFNVYGAENRCMVVDTAKNITYWLREDADSKASRLYSMQGSPEIRMIWGRVTNAQGSPLQGVVVRAKEGQRSVCVVTSDEAGQYRLFLRHGQDYVLEYGLKDYFIDYQHLSQTAPVKDRLIAEYHADVVLRSLPLEQRIVYTDLFGPNADVELSSYGKDQLQLVIQFLKDNPHVSAEMALSNDLTADQQYNRMLTQSRVEVLKRYLLGEALPEAALSFRNACEGEDGCQGATGESKLVIVLHKN